MWNYRVCEEVLENNIKLYHIREVYYDPTGEKPTGFTTASVDDWESLDDLKGTLELMKTAFDKPVIKDGIVREKK